MHSKKLNPDRLVRLVAALAETANVSEAARRVRISRWLAYQWYRRSKNNDPGFGVLIDDEHVLPLHEAWDAALEVGTDRLEAVATMLATGYQDPLTYQGQITTEKVWDELLDCYVERPVTITKYSERMLEILLKARRPEAYRERHEHHMTGKAAGGVLVVPGIADPAAWEKAAAAQQEDVRGNKDEDEDNDDPLE